jgi:tRNA (guanine37-N1)-methyltransferase
VRIDVFTIFPEVVSGYCGASILGRAVATGALDVRVHDLRGGADDPHRSVDDSPFGGGAGMVLMAEPLFRSVEAVADLPRPVFLLTPGGRRFDQSVAAELAGAVESVAAGTGGTGRTRGTGGTGGSGGFSLLCGRYEGVDQRVADHLVDGELSVGDYVLAGGELAALVVVEAVARLLPDVLGNEESARDESFAEGLLEYPQYTRPASFRGWEVPEVLRSGDHGLVAAWRRRQALVRTAERRPDLIERLVRASALDVSDVRALAEHGYDVPSGTAQTEQTDRPE